MNRNEKNYIIENGHFIREIEVIRFSGGFYTIKVIETGKYLKVHPSRIYSTQEDAENVAIKKNKHDNYNAQFL